MYTTCIYCQKDLGRNEIIEHFPVGRRLAFDATQGRLWVVCRHCERWNLTPLETRWEAIEDAERTFRETRLRISTDNIGLARVSEGLELIRIGDPLRPEIAAWRYGDQFGRRRRRAMLATGAGVLVFGAVAAGASAAGIGVGGFYHLPYMIAQRRVQVRLRDKHGNLLEVRGRDLRKVNLSTAGTTPWLTVPHKGADEPTVFKGEEAIRAAGPLMARINRMGGRRATVLRAVDELETIGSAERALAAAPHRTLQKIPTTTRLAIEMALHEEQERRALEGELAVLEAAWREAEEIAHIADNMFVPEHTQQLLQEMKTQRQ